MSVLVQWAAPSTLTTVITTTETHNLTNASLTAASTASVDNTSTRYRYMTLELAIGLGPTTSVNGWVYIYLLKSLDGTNFEDCVTTNRQAVCATLPYTVGHTAQRRIAKNIRVPPLVFKFAIENWSGGTWSGDATLKAQFHSELV